jgi:hypothetical protein
MATTIIVSLGGGAVASESTQRCQYVCAQTFASDVGGVQTPLGLRTSNQLKGSMYLLSSFRPFSGRSDRRSMGIHRVIDQREKT